MSMHRKVLVAAALAVVVALGARATSATLTSDGDGPFVAVIRLDEAERIWVKQHDDSWLFWINGAPEFVNREFNERYVGVILDGPPGDEAAGPSPTPTMPTPVPTPTPAPTPPTEARGFTITGQGSAVRKIEASGELVCSADVTGNERRVGTGEWRRIEPQGFRVVFSGTGYRKPTGRLGLEPYAREEALDPRHVEAAEQTKEPRVLAFGGSGREAFLAPYTVRIVASQEGRWTVRCNPVATMPEARGFSLGEYGDSAGKAPHDHVLGEGIIDIAGDVAGLLSCWFELYAPRVGYSMSSILGSFQWAVWGRDDAGEPKAIVTTYSRGKRIWFGDERPGEYQAFNPPYGLEVWTLSTVRWAVSCEPVTP